MHRILLAAAAIATVAIALFQAETRLHSQPPQVGPPEGLGTEFGPPPPNDFRPGAREFRRRGPGGRGFGGPGGPFQEDRKLVAKFDIDKDGWLNVEERATARQELPAESGRRGPGGRGFRGPGPGGPGFGRRENTEPPKSGEHVDPSDVEIYPDAELYDPSVLRTLFLQFENDDWEKELADFHNTDVEVPATLTVDGKEYPNVGVHFRGMSSYMGVPAGYKRSLNLSLKFVNKEQRLYGYRTLNLLNAHEDESFMSTVLYSHIARQYVPAPKANFVRVVINGEDWGVYTNAEQFNKDFIKSNYGSELGNRWKVRGNPGADGGLRYLGEDIEPYKQRFTIKSKDEEKAWRDLIALCRTLEKTPPDKLEAALEPMLDIDGTLKFLALDVALVNNDGYWVRASDYSLYQDPAGRFHLIPSDMNESFRGGGGPPGGPGMRGRRGRGRFGGGFRPDGDRRQPGDAEQGERPRRDRDDRRRPEDDRFGFGPPPGPDGFGPPPGPPGFGPPGFGPPGFGPPGGPGGPGRGGVELDPLIGLDNERTPLRSKLLAVPELKTRYLEYVRKIADDSLDWNKLGPVVANFRQLISDAVERDTRKLSSFEAFEHATAADPSQRGENERGISLRTFADKRRAYLLEQTDRAMNRERPAAATEKSTEGKND
jgi:spore coat protein CotH